MRSESFARAHASSASDGDEVEEVEEVEEEDGDESTCDKPKSSLCGCSTAQENPEASSASRSILTRLARRCS